MLALQKPQTTDCVVFVSWSQRGVVWCLDSDMTYFSGLWLGSAGEKWCLVPHEPHSHLDGMILNQGALSSLFRLSAASCSLRLRMFSHMSWRWLSRHHDLNI